MTSVILRNTTQVMLPLLLLFSVFLLLRGHNEPGGGFSGGLVAAAAFALYALAFDVVDARRALVVNPRSLMGAGLILALASGLLGLFRGQPLFTHRDSWIRIEFPDGSAWDVGTPLLFDVGVYLVVVGVTLTIILQLAED